MEDVWEINCWTWASRGAGASVRFWQEMERQLWGTLLLPQRGRTPKMELVNPDATVRSCSSRGCKASQLL